MSRHPRMLRRLASAWLLLAVACSGGDEAGRRADAPATPSREDAEAAPVLRASDEGLYRVSLRPQAEPAPLGQLHAWIFHVETREGSPFVPTLLSVSGGMPQHSHGFVTEPRVTRSLGGGDFLIEGVKFHMSGDWTFRIEIVGPAGSDVATFQVPVGP